MLWRVVDSFIRFAIQLSGKERNIPDLFSRFEQCWIVPCFIALLTRRSRYTQLFRERLSGKVHATILKGIVGGFEFSFFQRNLKELARKAMEMCLRVLKESNKSRFDSYSRQEPCTDHIPYYLSGLSRAFSDNLSRNSCIARTRDVSSKINNMYQVIVPPIMIS